MIRRLLAQLRQTGLPTDILVESGTTELSRSALLDQVESLAQFFRAEGIQTIALYADNGIEWIVTDLASQLAEIRIIPLPLFFSDEQIRHAIASSGADALLRDRPIGTSIANDDIAPVTGMPVIGNAALYRFEPGKMAKLPPLTQKITFTSGTTGTPKGVCLSAELQFTVAKTLADSIDLARPKHLCVLPMSTLLENIAGIYAPLMAGGKIIAPPLAELGFKGSSEMNIGEMLASISRHLPDSLILVPELLNALTIAAEQGWQPPGSLDFIAVGGGKVSPDLLRRARAAGLPTYEGYGLSECGSVVALNLPGIDRPGSAGRPLPHVHVQIEDGEIVVAGSTFLGYANQPETWTFEPVRTGDLGHIDKDGFIYIDGRKKNQFISSYGRNLSPEWVESELLAGPLLQQAVLFGDARPYCVALVYPRDVCATDSDINAWITKTNLQLPDYARVQDWCRLPQPLSGQDGLVTANGRPKRSNIEQKYAALIDDLYVTNRRVNNL